MNEQREQNWYPSSKIPFYYTMISNLLEDAEESYDLFKTVQENETYLEEHTITRTINIFTEQKDIIASHRKQLSKWKCIKLTDTQKKKVDNMQKKLKKLEKLGKSILKIMNDKKENTLFESDSLEEMLNNLDKMI